jgi:hypothetical protein
MVADGATAGAGWYGNQSIPLSANWLVPRGTFVIGAGAYSGGTGALSLSGALLSESVTGCAQATLTNVTITTSQSLTSTDCSSGSRYADEFVIFYDGSCTIEMRSSAFDAFLTIANTDGVYITDDDDSAGGTNARIVLPRCTVTPAANNFGGAVIRATSYDSQASGAYTLIVALGPPNVALSSDSRTEEMRFSQSVAPAQRPVEVREVNAPHSIRTKTKRARTP